MSKNHVVKSTCIKVTPPSYILLKYIYFSLRLFYTAYRRFTMIESVDFAKYILLKAKERNLGEINVTKLQKLLYICDGTLLAFDCNAINENARAWYYGPVYPKVYKWFSKNPNYTPTIDDIPVSTINEINGGNYDAAINATFTAFGSWNATTLSGWSHQPNSPWSKAIEINNGKMNCIIRKSDMAEYFKGIVHAN